MKRTEAIRKYRGWLIERKFSCKYNYVLSKGSEVVRLADVHSFIECFDFIDEVLYKEV